MTLAEFLYRGAVVRHGTDEELHQFARDYADLQRMGLALQLQTEREWVSSLSAWRIARFRQRRRARDD